MPLCYYIVASWHLIHYKKLKLKEQCNSGTSVQKEEGPRLNPHRKHVVHSASFWAVQNSHLPLWSTLFGNLVYHTTIIIARARIILFISRSARLVGWPFFCTMTLVRMASPHQSKVTVIFHFVVDIYTIKYCSNVFLSSGSESKHNF